MVVHGTMIQNKSHRDPSIGRAEQFVKVDHVLKQIELITSSIIFSSIKNVISLMNIIVIIIIIIIIISSSSIILIIIISSSVSISISILVNMLLLSIFLIEVNVSIHQVTM